VVAVKISQLNPPLSKNHIKVNLKNTLYFFLMLIFIIAFNLIITFLLIGNLEFENYKNSLFVWSDFVTFNEFAKRELYSENLTIGSSFYPVMMYKFFGDSLIWPIVINSLMMLLSYKNLSLLGLRGLSNYFFWSSPIIYYFSLGYSKEITIICGLSYLALNLYQGNIWKLFVSAILLGFARPVILLGALPIYFKFSQKKLSWILIFSLLFTPLFFPFISALQADGEYYQRHSDFANLIRFNYPIISFIGNLLALIKTYLELFFTSSEQRGVQWAFLTLFFVINLIYLVRNKALFSSGSCWLLWLIFITNLNSINHFRYFFPVLFVMGAVTLSRSTSKPSVQ